MSRELIVSGSIINGHGSAASLTKTTRYFIANITRIGRTLCSSRSRSRFRCVPLVLLPSLSMLTASSHTAPNYSMDPLAVMYILVIVEILLIENIVF